MPGSSIFPLPMPQSCRDALQRVLDSTDKKRDRAGKTWSDCHEAWCGLTILGLNNALSFTTDVGPAVNPAQEKVCELLSKDCCDFVRGDGLGKDGSRSRAPEVPWSQKIGDLSVNYTGDIVEKARWLTWEQVQPGLPPEGRGGSLEAVSFCDSWVKKHLENPALTRLKDEEVVDPLPHAVVRATQDHWEVIACELVKRGVACVIPEDDIATCRGEPVLNGAFGVTKPGKWVGEPSENRPVLRLIMDFRAANALHRELPGAVTSLVGPAKWQGFVLDKGEVLLTSGDDLVSSFYLFKIPYAWSRYFAFRKKITRRALNVPGNPSEEVYIASCVLPMGWTAAVTIMQHIHREIALSPGGLQKEKEIRRDKQLPRKEPQGNSSFWNLYIDDLTVMDFIQDESHRLGGSVSDIQAAMQQLYRRRGVPYSEDKSTTRQPVAEKLGSLVDGVEGTLGVTTKRSLEFISLVRFLVSQERVPTKWVQILLGKFVHIMQFRRQVFSCIQASWDRLKFHHGGPMREREVDEWLMVCCLLPLCRMNLRARLAGTVTASDASESGGGLCASLGLSQLGRRGLEERKGPSDWPVIVIEWFAGIGGLAQAVKRLGLAPVHIVVCECDEHCLAVLRSASPGCTVFKDIQKVTKEELVTLFNRFPNARGVVQGGGSPCQGLSLLSAGRAHFSDERSALFYELVRVSKLVEEICKERGLWHFGFAENVLCDEEDQEVFRRETGWSQYLACSEGLSWVRRPRFFWVSNPLKLPPEVWSQQEGHYTKVVYMAPKEPPELWVSPGWEWLGKNQGVSLPTFTRSIPRARPPWKPAGLAHTDSLARERWAADKFRFPPYTYKEVHCMTDGHTMRVASPGEREALMGFLPGHTYKKVRSWNRTPTADERSASVGNSFHTGVVANLIRDGLLGLGIIQKFPSPLEINTRFQAELRECQKEVYQPHGQPFLQEPFETWLERLEAEQPSQLPPPEITLNQEAMVVQRMTELLSYRGTDVHVDTFQFYRPDRLPTGSIDSRQWNWRIVKGWRWRYAHHINKLELEALYQSLRWRSRALRNYDARFLHLTDSQVVLGVAAKGRTSSKLLFPTLHRYNMLVLAMHTYPILGWVASEDNPADEPSRWFVLQ